MAKQATDSLRLGLVGATGAMGRRVLGIAAPTSAAGAAAPKVVLAAVLAPRNQVEATRAAILGHPGITITDDAEAFVRAADVVLDFSAPSQASRVAPVVAAAGKPYVVASTGLSADDHACLDCAAKHAPILQAANLSLGVQVLTELVRQAAGLLQDWDVEVVEMHHGRKVDGPSGTALALGQAAQSARPELQSVVGRSHQANGRAPTELGYSVVRGGDVPGEHMVYFFGQSERLELCHRSQSADIFARGALAACWRLALAPAGRYTMATLPSRRS